MTDTYLDLPILSFKDQKTFEEWLAKHHDSTRAIWVRFYNKASGVPTLTYMEALEVALCYGWIDSQVKKLDEPSHIQKFTPRKSKSPWSQRNKDIVARMIEEKRMRSPGLAAIQTAKKNGQWDAAYSRPSQVVPSPAFQNALDKNKKARDFFASLSKTQQFYFVYWIDSAKRDETKEKRIKESIQMLSRGEKRM